MHKKHFYLHLLYNKGQKTKFPNQKISRDVATSGSFSFYLTMAIKQIPSQNPLLKKQKGGFLSFKIKKF